MTLNLLQKSNMISRAALACAMLGLIAAAPGCKNNQKKPPKDTPEGEEAAPAEPKPSVLLPDPRNTVPASGEIQHVALIYSVSGRRMLGHLVRYENPGSAPILLLLDEHVDAWLQQRAEAYARLGYNVLCPDLSELAGETFDQPVLDNVTAAIAEAERQLGRTPVGRYAAVGWGRGGGQALTLARYMDLEALVICYGPLITTPEALQKVREPILGIFGRLDTEVPPERVEEFRSILQRMGGRFEGNVWSDEGHNFMRAPNDPTNAREADIEIISWLDTYFVP